MSRAPCTTSCGLEAFEALSFPGADSMFSNRCGAISGRLRLRPGSLALRSRRPKRLGSKDRRSAGYAAAWGLRNILTPRPLVARTSARHGRAHNRPRSAHKPTAPSNGRVAVRQPDSSSRTFAFRTYSNSSPPAFRAETKGRHTGTLARLQFFRKIILKLLSRRTRLRLAGRSAVLR